MRRRMLSVSGKPYDAELEYIASTSSNEQFFETGLAAFLPLNCEFDVMPYGFSSVVDTLMGGMFYVQNGRFWVCTFQTDGRTNCGLTYNALSTLKVSKNVRHKISINFANGNQKLYVDGELFSSATNTVSGTPYAAYNLRLGHRWVHDSEIEGGRFYGRYYGAKISNASKVLRDYIPVRKGKVGYLYDKANPTGGPLGNGLYPNAGTGSFELGPDK